MFFFFSLGFNWGNMVSLDVSTHREDGWPELTMRKRPSTDASNWE